MFSVARLLAFFKMQKAMTLYVGSIAGVFWACHLALALLLCFPQQKQLALRLGEIGFFLLGSVCFGENDEKLPLILSRAYVILSPSAIFI